MLKSFFILLSLLIATDALFAIDLPAQSTVGMRTFGIEIFDVLNASIKQQSYDPATSSHVASLNGILEIELSVQGNICGSDPKTLSVLIQRTSKNETGLSLSVASKYAPNPNILSACTAHGKISKVTLPIELSTSIFPGDLIAPKKYVIQSHPLFSSVSFPVQKVIIVTVNAQSQYEATVETLP